jgi:hypothetical protein
LIRHARLRPALPVLALTVAMIPPSFRTVLVTAVGTAVLMESGLVAAGEAAIALTSVTVRAEIKHSPAFAAKANPLPENQFAMSRHASSQAGLDNGNGFVSL